MSARCVRLLLFCLLVSLTAYLSVAQPRLLPEEELERNHIWRKLPETEIYEPTWQEKQHSFKNLADLAQKSAQGNAVVAVMLDEQVFRQGGWEHLKKCQNIQALTIWAPLEASLDSLFNAIADLPIQQLTISAYSYSTDSKSPIGSVRRIPSTISRLKYLRSVTLNGNRFDWDNTFQQLATIKALQRLTVSNLQQWRNNTQVIDLSGIKQMQQVSELTVELSSTNPIRPELGLLSQLKKLTIYEGGTYKVDTAIARQVIDGLGNLESLAVPVNYIGKGDIVNRLIKLRSLRISAHEKALFPLLDLSALVNLEELDMTNLRLSDWPTGLCALTQLRKIRLNGNQFKEIPDCLGQFHNLEVLAIQGNPIRKLPVFVGQLTKLQEIDVSYCQLDTLPDVFGELKAVKSLNLSQNQLKLLPNSMQELALLEALQVQNNKLRRLNNIASWKKLRLLDLTNNQLEQLPTAVGELTNLNTLLLYSNNLSVLPSTIGKLKKLSTLNVGSNKLAQLPAELSQLKQLKQLMVNNNDLVALPEGIGQLDSLKSLNIEHNRIAVLPNDIGRCRLLTDFNFQQNQLTVLPEEFGQLTALKVLQLRDNPLQQLPASIGNLTSLRVINLAKTNIRFLPSGIGKLARLSILIISDSDLMALPDEIGQCQELSSITIQSSQLTVLPNSIGRLQKLQGITIGGNGNKPGNLQALPDSIIQCKALRSISIANQPVFDADDAFQKLVQLPALEMISMTDCKLSRWPEVDWKKSTLRSVMLWGNALTSVPTALLDAPKLQMVSLTNNPLPKPLDAMFSSKDQLRIALAEIGQISLGSSAKPNWSVANGFMQSSRRKSMQRDWSGTLDDLNKAVEYAPDSMASIVYSQRAEFQFFRRQFNESIADFDKALTYWPKLTNSISGPNNAGRGLETQKRLRATWWARKAMARGQLAQYDAALKDATQAVQLMPPLPATPNREDAQAAGMVYIEQGRFQLLTNHRKEMLESFTKAMDAYEKIQYAEPGIQLTTVELGIISQQYDRATKALDKLDEFQRRDGYATLYEYLKTCLAVLTEKQTPAQATEAMQAYVRTHGNQIMGWSFDLFDAWLTGTDLPAAKADTLKQLTATAKERAVKME